MHLGIAEITNIVLAVMTGVYAWLTYHIVHANRASVEVMLQQLESTTRPYVDIDAFFEPGIPIFKLRIRNTGKSAAHNLRLSMDTNFYRFDSDKPEMNLREAVAFNRPIETFPPGAALVFGLGSSYKIYQNSGTQPSRFEITASYQFFNKTVNERTTIDLEMFYGTDAAAEPLVQELTKVTKEIEKIERTLSRSIAAR
jgi:hypothetical protein